MDGFDDLLNPSRQALEENPFADPFLKRSGSPDPWATPFASTDHASEGFGSTAEHFATEPTYESSAHEFASSSTNEEAYISDPLDSAAHHEDEEEDNKPLGNLRSPGFRESVPSNTTFSETATIRPTKEEETYAEPPSPLPSVHEPGNDTAAHQTASAPTAFVTPSHSNSSFASPPLSATEPNFKSPLDSFRTIEQSMGGLSLGGETATGWQPEETPWQSEHFAHPQPKAAQSEEDSDDDKPILQAFNKQHDDNTSVFLCRTHRLRSCLNTYHLFLDHKYPNPKR